MKTLDKAILASEIIKQRKAIKPILFEVGKMTSITDYFLIASGSSSRQVQSISRHLTKEMRNKGHKAYGIEGEQEGHWILVDYGDLVIHIFFEPIRELYDLEGLWNEAPRIDIDEEKKDMS